MITLVLGGTRSGKSEVAERIAAGHGPRLTYLATAVLDPADADHAARIARHAARRGADWSVREAGAALTEHLAAIDEPVLVDSLGTWLTAHDDLDTDADELVSVLLARTAPTVLVSEEVGMSVHAPTELGRRFQDRLGLINQAVAAVAQRTVLVVAGRTVELS